MAPQSPGKVGMVVYYQPTEKEYPMSRNQMAAIITSWNEETEAADLAVFPPGTNYFLAKHGAVEGLNDGDFQQPGTQSNTAKAQAEAKKAQQKAQEEAVKKANEDAKKAATAPVATPVHQPSTAR